MTRANSSGIYRGMLVCANAQVLATYWPEKYPDWKVFAQPRVNGFQRSARHLIRKEEPVQGTVLGWTQRALGIYEAGSTYYGDGNYEEYDSPAFYATERIDVLAVAPVSSISERFKPIIYVLPTDVLVKVKQELVPTVPARQVVFEYEQYFDATIFHEEGWSKELSIVFNRVHCPEVQQPEAGMLRKCMYAAIERISHYIPIGYTFHATGMLKKGTNKRWNANTLERKVWHKVLVATLENPMDNQRFSKPILLEFPG